MLSTLFLLTVDPEIVLFECQRLWRPPEFSFNLTWTLPTYLRYGNVINSFVVVPKLREGNLIIPVPIDNVTVPFPQVTFLSAGHGYVEVTNDAYG